MSEGELYKKVEGKRLKSFDDNTEWEMVRISYMKEILDEAKRDFPKFSYVKKPNGDVTIQFFGDYMVDSLNWFAKWFGVVEVKEK